MPDIGFYHPQIVHFVIALGIMGAVLRVVSLTGKLKWTSPSAATLLITAGAVSFFAAASGHDAHGPVERVPNGSNEAVEEHEEWGDRTRNLFLVIAGLEIVGLALRQHKAAKLVHGLTAVGGLIGIAFIYETGEHGGTLVYDYAGGVGIRSGEPGDLTNLLVAGLYHRGLEARRQGNREMAARLFDELARQEPDNPSARLIALESQLEDRNDAAGALAGLHQFTPPEGNRRATFQYRMLQARAYAAAGYRDSALAIVSELKAMAPQSRLIEELEKSINQ